MSLAVEMFLWAAALIISLPLAILVIECLAALLPLPPFRWSMGLPRPCCAVLVPAHNEEAGIARTLASILPQLAPGDRLIVIADNCSDGTAAVARSVRAEVIERVDPHHRGKGFALQFGIQCLEPDPPAVVLIVDADCHVPEGAIDQLTRAASQSGRPVQAGYVMTPPPTAGCRDQISAFAVRCKNVVRPRGLHRLGLPCLLTGTGMAFPWTVLRAVNLAHGNIVEDMQLGIDLALAGRPPLFCPEVRVTGELASGRRAATDQRTRWEHGHLRTLLTQVPRLLGAALCRRRLDLVALALELCVPPLSLLLLLTVALQTFFTIIWLAGGPGQPAGFLGGCGLAALTVLFVAWLRFGPEDLSGAALLAAPVYIVAKAPIYFAFLLRPQHAWVRTERTIHPSGSTSNGTTSADSKRRV